MITVFVSFVIVLGLFFLQLGTIRDSVYNNVKTDLNAYSINFDNQIAFVASDILLMEDLVKNKNSLVLDGQSLSFVTETDRELLENDFIDWITIHKIYDQIRIIGLDGVEVLRVNNNGGNAVVVPQENLQDKSGRYYFENAINLDDDVLYLSKIDLNIENGEIEYVDGEPKQMLRIGSTIYNQAGEKIGLIIVNYFADNLFHDADANISTYTAFEVINDQGYYLHHPDETREYGFMFEDGQDLTFENFYSFDLSSISDETTHIEQEQVSFNTYTYYVLDNHKMEDAITESLGREIQVYSDNGNIVIFGVIRLNEIDVYLNLRNTYIIIFVVLILFLFIVSRLIDEITFGREQHIKMLEYTSNHDILTGLMNRKSIFSMMEYLTSRHEKFIVLFLDLDGFKKVNDTYGHSIGDKLLIEVSERLKRVVRQTDYVARLGGDEFIIVLRDADSDSIAKETAKKISSKVEEPFSCTSGTCSLGVSIGISIQHGDKTVESLVNDADQKMYQEKETRKAN